ncbi:MAG TPA: response regulator [Rubrivivax sp.]|jgi:PleD family two-component response regulator|nr:response regulator [Rubrivivax sp.]
MTPSLIDDSPPVLVTSDRPQEAEAIARLLGDEFAKVHASTDPRRCLEDFELIRPGVVVLAFDRFEKSERHLKRLREPALLVHALAHKVIVLCNEEDAREAYEACKKQHIDDFVMFQPRGNEIRPLRLAVRRALAQVSSERGGSPVRAVVAQARRAGAWDGLVEDSAAAGAAPSLLSAVRALRSLAEHFPPVVLMIDDDRLQHKLLRQLLAPLKLSCAFASSAAQGIATLHRRRPDLILMDVRLPGIDGIEATRLLKSAAHFAAIPVIMITGVGGKDVVVESLKAGAVDFVVKPFDGDSVLAKVRRVLYA